MFPRRLHVSCVVIAALLTVSFQIGTSPLDAVVDPASAAPESARSQRVRAVEDHLRAGAKALSSLEIERTAAVLVREADLRGFDPGLVLAVIEIESHFDAFAVSRVGAMGLMQVMPATGAYLAERHGVEWRGPRTLFDPVANVTLGIAYLEELRDRFDELSTALAAYNYGPSAIGARVRTGAPVPARYARAVLAVWERTRTGA